jgi:hypothetical protein
VFTLLEILRGNPTLYDSDHKKFVDLVSDNRIVVATYVQLARDAAKLGAYAAEKCVWNLDETSMDFASISSHFTSKQMASSAFISPSCPKMSSKRFGADYQKHRQFHVSKSGWLSKNQERQRLCKRLQRFVPKDKRTDINGRNHDCAAAYITW